MELKDIVAISGMSGLFAMESQRENGIIVKPLDEEKRKFVSSRQHMFTPLENITIYTQTDTIEMKDVLHKMKEHEKDYPPSQVDLKNNQALNDYFANVLPDYDRDKVYPSDIKKLIKWYILLDNENLIPAKESSPKPEEETKPEDEEKE